ncbi:MAG: RsiG family protein [Gaiellaceae bacterium]
MEPLPDLASLSDDELRALIAELKQEEDDVSYHRRLLHGKIDILRAELVARLQKSVEGGEANLGADIERLTEILASKAPPPDEPA